MMSKNKNDSVNSADCVGERLVKRLAAAGVASRRAAGDLVLAGRVTVNGERVLEPGRRVTAEDRVELDGVLLPEPERKHYIMLHKPRGYVCTNADRFAEKKALDLIRLDPPVRLFSAGRLDKESEGLILFSNDGDFVAALTHPRHEICKEYRVHTARPIPAAQRERLCRGIEEGGERLRARHVEELAPCCYRFILNEGRKREIRRMTAAAGAPTRRLIRLRIGALTLGDLPPGHWRELTPAEAQLARTPEPEFRAAPEIRPVPPPAERDVR